MKKKKNDFPTIVFLPLLLKIFKFYGFFFFLLKIINDNSVINEWYLWVILLEVVRDI